MLIIMTVVFVVKIITQMVVDYGTKEQSYSPICGYWAL